jgi:hypothetical protein
LILTTEEELRAELEYLRKSRELRLGIRLRQNRFLNWVRYLRWKDRLIQVYSLPTGTPGAGGNHVCLLNVWCADYPFGIPFELLEQKHKYWEIHPDSQAPKGQVLITQRSDSIKIYSQDENLRLDFRTDDESGQIAIESKGVRQTINLYSPNVDVLSLYPNRIPFEIVGPTLPPAAGDPMADSGWKSLATQANASDRVSKDHFFTSDVAWIERQQQTPRPLSINHPEWRGILASASELFDNILTIPDNLNKERGQYYARMIAAAGCPSVTIQGFPRSYEHLIIALNNLAPQIPINVIYHGNFLHMREDYDWLIFKRILALHQEGAIAKVGLVKQGMAEILQAAGVRASFILNMVKQIPSAPSEPLPNGIHLGIWGQPDWSWKKSPYAMLASVKLVDGAVAHVYNVSPRATEFGGLLGIRGEYYADALPQSQVRRVLATMNLNLYVTLTECAPMLPLESLSAGTPCLFGPTSHYFRDDDYLHSRLVIPQPDDAQAIAEFANQAIHERDRIILAYRAYAPGYNRRARQILADFLEYPLEVN